MQRVFILGNPRSGTSLLRLMLNSHPFMTAPPESGFLHWWYSKYGAWNLHDAKAVARIQEFVNDLLTSRKIETWKIDKEELIKFIMQHQPATYGELGSLVYEYWSTLDHKVPQVILDKNNYYIHYLNDLLSIWPEAKFIFLIRDGRDVACSYLDLQKLDSQSPYKPKLPVTIEAIATDWLKNNQEIYEFLSTLPKERWLMLKYEDLVTRTREELTAVTSFLNIEFSDQMLSYYTMPAEPASTLDWKRKTLEKPDASNIGRYATNLKPEEIELFNKKAGNMLNFAGYAQ